MVKGGANTALFLPTHWQADVNLEIEGVNLFLVKLINNWMEIIIKY